MSVFSILSCFFDHLWFYPLKWKCHLAFYQYFFKFINNRKRCLTARSQDYLPIGNHKNKYIVYKISTFRSQNLLIFFQNFCNRNCRRFPEIWAIFKSLPCKTKNLANTRKFIRVIFLDFVICKSCACCKPIFLQIQYNTIKVLREIKLLYSQKFIWQNSGNFLIGNSRKYINAKLKNFAIFRTCEKFPE